MLKDLKNNFLILLLYVDDILLAENDKLLIETIKDWLSSIFDMKDMGEASYVLDVKINRDCSQKFFSLTQRPI